MRLSGRQGVTCVVFLSSIDYGDHMTREKVYYLAVGHLLVVVGVHDLEKDYQILFFAQDSHLEEELTEFVLVQDTVSVRIHKLEKQGEFMQEFLMLCKLEVEDRLLEFGIGQLFLDHISIYSHSMKHFLS